MILRELVAQGDPDGDTLAAQLAGVLVELAPDRLDVAVAYATQSGLKSLRDAIGEWPPMTRWVIGLDDAITQPAAIDEVMALHDAEVRLASLSKSGRRFHPKLYCFWSSEHPARCVVVIGSANMTLHGLERNGEVGVILSSETVEEAGRLKSAWTEMALLGSEVGKWDLDAYRASYERARKARRRMVKINAIPPQPEVEEDATGPVAFDGDPFDATVGWTEGASPSAGGKDLEFPRKMMPYFHLLVSPTTKLFRMVNGEVFPLTFTMRTDNQMWRLMFSRDAIQAGVGRDSLRPVAGGNRSDLTIVFHRLPVGSAADFDVELIPIGSPEHAQLLARSNAEGVLERTRDPGGRYFGYF